MNSVFELRQTPNLIDRGGRLLNELVVTAPFSAGAVPELRMNGERVLCAAPEGDVMKAYVPEPAADTEAEFSLPGLGARSVTLRRPRHWTVHLVQFSHHDPGYTEVPSHVLDWGVDQLRDGLRYLEEREDWPDDARPRFVIEQAYTLAWFLRRCSPEEKERLFRQIRLGNVEVTALWANLISELLSPEEAIRALRFARGVAEETGVPIVSAEHNDITGVTWGYATLLARAGVKYFLPAMPRYYDWGVTGYESFWDVKKLFGKDWPGAFWWETPEGEKLFFWAGNHGCGDESGPELKELFPELERLDREGWPHDVLRWEVRASDLDNFGYSEYFSDFVRKWNETYAWPRLVCSTDRRFCEDFLSRLKTELPTYRGGVDGQDYPIASTSQMASSARARQLHGLLRSTELLTTLAPDWGAHPDLNAAWEDLLFADEHAFGYKQPADPRQLASWWEHGVWAARAWADAWTVWAGSAGALAAGIAPKNGAPRLTVFRTAGAGEPTALGIDCTELKNELLDGRFALTDRETGEEVPYELEKIDWDGCEPAAAVRAGMGAGTKQMGLFDPPTNRGYVLRFTAKGLPACGRKTWDLVPTDRVRAVRPEPCEKSVENEYYRVLFDEAGILDVVDKTDGRSLLDPAAAVRLGTVLVRYANETPVPMRVTGVSARKSPVRSVITVRGEADGLYSVRLELSLAAGEDAVRVALRVVKSKKPLQTVFAAFPFAGTGVRYQSVLHDTSPAADTLCGSQSDVLAVQDWVLAEGSDVLWNSANAPIVSLSHLWPGYISPAHRCVLPPPGHPPLAPEAFDTGHVYSVLTCNNFGTNFFTSQLSDALYVYTFAGRHGRAPAEWGAAAAETVSGVFSYGAGGTEPGRAEFLRVPGLRVLALKQADDGRGWILRLKNDTDGTVTAPVTLLGRPARLLAECSLPETDEKALGGSAVTLDAGRLGSFRLEAPEPAEGNEK